MRANSSSAGGDAVARVDDEQHEIGRGRGPPSSAGACGRRWSPRLASSKPAVSNRVIGVAAKLRLALAPVAREPRKVETSASRVPVRRLKSVDLPTFGRPTIAIFGDMACFRFEAAYAAN